MSKQFVESFFPNIFARLRRTTPTIIDFFFPDDVAQLCPEVAVDVHGYFTIHNPVLAVGAVVGILIGLGGAWRLGPTMHVSWTIAFLCFGLMNATALPLHCFLPDDDTKTMPEHYPIWWMLDCLFTGWSATALTSACLDLYLRRSLLVEGKMLPYIWWLGNAILAALSITSFASHQVTLGLELVYLLPIGIAACALWPLMIWSSLNNWVRQERGWIILLISICVSALGGTIVVLGALLDATVCRYIGQPWGDTFMVATMAFWGCDVAFAGIAVWLLNAVDLSSKPAAKKKNF
jgi:hypothetical protein